MTWRDAIYNDYKIRPTLAQKNKIWSIVFVLENKEKWNRMNLSIERNSVFKKYLIIRKNVG